MVMSYNSHLRMERLTQSYLSHHYITFKDENIVVTALKEITRVLKPQGTALISVWSRWQDKFYRHFLKELIIRNRDFGDIDIYWRQHNLNIPRFYHLYSRGEFLQELQRCRVVISSISNPYEFIRNDFLTIISLWYKKDNLFKTNGIDNRDRNRNRYGYYCDRESYQKIRWIYRG